MNRWKNDLMLPVKMCEATRHIQGHNGSKHIQQGGWETLFVGLQNLRVIGITLGVSSNTWPTWPCSQLSPSIEPNLASSRSAIKVNVLTASVDGLLAMREASATVLHHAIMPHHDRHHRMAWHGILASTALQQLQSLSSVGCFISTIECLAPQNKLVDLQPIRKVDQGLRM